MKANNEIYFRAGGLLILALLTISTSIFAQSKSEPKCYIVVGAFKMERNAQNFAEFLKAKYLTPSVRKNTYKNLYYVYTFESENRENTVIELEQIREKFPDLEEAWLYAGDFKGPHIPADQWNVSEEKSSELITEEEIEPETSVRKPASEVTSEEDKIESKEEEEEVVAEEEESAEPSWDVYLNTINSTNFKEVKGNFLVFDAERNQQITSIPTHELVKIEDPNNRTNRIRVQSDIFGYHQLEHTFDLDEPLKSDENGLVEVAGDSIILNLKLAQLRKGDVSTLWKVYFFKDAAIMREESVYELNQLFEMLKNNPNMKILIHGHTNGNSHGKVLHLDLDDKDFFTLNGSHEETFASAKKLSLYRAYTIQHWLMDQGIDEERMEIKGWGGKKMIYDKFDSQADKNVRVEIEITEE